MHGAPHIAKELYETSHMALVAGSVVVLNLKGQQSKDYLHMSKVSKNELNNWINELLKNIKIIRVFGDSNNCFIIHSREKKVEFDNTNEKLKNVFKKSGLYHFEIGFSPSLLKFTQEGKYFHSKNDMFGKKIETFNAYDSWFSKLFDALNSKVILIPDTNIIKYYVYTNYLKRLSLTYSIQIPRLTILG